MRSGIEARRFLPRLCWAQGEVGGEGGRWQTRKETSERSSSLKSLLLVPGHKPRRLVATFHTPRVLSVQRVWLQHGWLQHAWLPSLWLQHAWLACLVVTCLVTIPLLASPSCSSSHLLSIPLLASRCSMSCCAIRAHGTAGRRCRASLPIAHYSQ